jgi:ribosomal 50S subunit-recycling heat shock protein
MRLDKFLKVSRLIKRRTLAKEACDSSRISINGRVAKASSELKIGDQITLNFAGKETHYRVLKLTEHVKKDDADAMYEMML